MRTNSSPHVRRDVTSSTASAVSAGPRPRQPQRTLRPLSSRPPDHCTCKHDGAAEAGEGEAHHCKCKHGDAEEAGDEQPKHCACKHDAEGHAISTEPHLGYVADLASLIEIQPESTVSRVVMREDGLRVVLFGFDKDQALSEHTAAMPVTIQVLEGKLRVGGEGREVELVPGGVVYLSARLPHTVYAVEPSKMLLSMFDNRG